MAKHLYEKFLSHYRYMVYQIDRYEENDCGDLIIYLKSGEMVVYDPITDRCRTLPRDPLAMTAEECNAELGARLRKIMRRENCSQEELAFQTGLSKGTISCYVRGKMAPSFYYMDKIAKVLNCSLDDFRYI